MTYPELEPNQFATLHRLASARIPAARLRQHIHASGGAWEQLLSPNPKLPWTKRQFERLETAAHAPLDETLLAETAIRGRVNAVCCADPEYPKSLLPFDDAPAVLFVRGTLPQDTPSVAIVGSRRPDPYGTRQARRFAEAFSRAGCVVVSGGAAGIDTAAHEATLEQAGCTVAVVGCGLDVDYPASNRRLFDRIAANGGCIVSEMPLGTRPEPWLFPVRNRIIAAWADATVVIEAPRDSGALITARNAAEYGKDVFVVPGPVDTGRSTGGHLLIRDGAMLADSPEDILAEWRASSTTASAQRSTSAVPDGLSPRVPERNPLSGEQMRLWQAANAEPVPLEILATSSGLSPAVAGTIATLLEMQGYLQRYAGNRYARATP